MTATNMCSNFCVKAICCAMERLGNNVRIAVVGTAGVGKSALTVRFLTGRFLQHYDPTLEDEYSTNLMWMENKEKSQFWMLQAK